MPMLMKLLKQKVELGILEPSSAPYSNRWFTVPKKNGTLLFIQDLQLVNKGYDQFQLAVESRDITTMRTPLCLVRTCTLPQGGTNSVAHMVNAMNRVLRDCIPDITMPFLDDIPIKGCQ